MSKYDANKSVVVPDYLFDKLISEENGENLVALWIRYARQARMQGGEDTESFDSFIISRLKWGVTKFRKTKAKLKRLGLIETKKVGGKWRTFVYGEIQPIENQLVENQYVENQPVTFQLVENPPTIDNIIIDNNIINKEEDNRKKAKKKKVKSEEDILKGKELNEVMGRYYDAIIDSGLIAKKEANSFMGVTAFRTLINSVDFARSSEGIDKAELVYSVARFALNDKFWSVKVIGPVGFCRHFAMLYAQAKKFGAIKTERKIDASKFEEGFNF